MRRRKKLVRSSRNKRFSVDVHVNEEIVAGKWKERFVMEDSTTIEVLEMIAEVYDLDEFVSDRLELVYVTHSTGGTKQIKRLDPPTLVLNAGSRTTKEGELIPITMDHLELFVHMRMKWMKTRAVTPNSCWSACRVLEQLYVNNFIGFHRMKPFIFSWTMHVDTEPMMQSSNT